LTFEEEENFLNDYLDRAKEGLLVTMPMIHIDYNLKVGKNVPKSTFYRMLARHGWRKVKPDTRHPHSKPEVQDEFKKNA
jgi:hypothetical protein